MTRGGRPEMRPPTYTTCHESWWIGLDRQMFDVRAAMRVQEMRQSKEGQRGLTTARSILPNYHDLEGL